MKLISVEIENFRPFRRVPPISLSDFNALIGANDVGKSAFLRALDAFFNSKPMVPEDWHKKNYTDPVVIEVAFDTSILPLHKKEAIREFIVGEKIRLRKEWTYDQPSRPIWKLYKLTWEDEEFQYLHNLKMEELNELIRKYNVEVAAAGGRITNADRIRALEQFAERRIGKALLAVEIPPAKQAIVAQLLPRYSFFEADTDLSTSQANFQKLFQPIIKEIIRAEGEQFFNLESKIKDEVSKKCERLSEIYNGPRKSYQKLR